nr:MAG TPA_asm: hypothetical protein [Bacteriophage sp.]
MISSFLFLSYYIISYLTFSVKIVDLYCRI